MVATARRMIDLGFGAMKVRFGRPRIEDDLAIVDAVRDAIGDGLTLMVDCNQGWRMPSDTARPWGVEDAWRVAERLVVADVFWMEEPLHRGDYDGMSELRRRVRRAGAMLIAGGEMTREPYEFRELLRRDCLDVFQPDAACTQGISGLSLLAREVIAAGKLFTPHTWGNGIGVRSTKSRSPVRRARQRRFADARTCSSRRRLTPMNCIPGRPFRYCSMTK